MGDGWQFRKLLTIEVHQEAEAPYLRQRRQRAIGWI